MSNYLLIQMLMLNALDGLLQAADSKLTDEEMATLATILIKKILEYIFCYNCNMAYNIIYVV